MTLKHIPATHNRKQPGENPTHYYAVYKLKNGGQGMAVMTYEDVLEHAKKFSKTYNKKTGKFSGPWADNFDAMAKKTVLLKLMKYMPMAADSPLAKAATVDGSQFTGAISEDKTPEFEFAPIDVEALELNNDSAEPIESDPETGATVDGSQFTGAISEDKTPEFEFAPIDVEALELNNDSAEPIESDPETGEINE